MTEREKRQIIEDAANRFRDQWNHALAEKVEPPKIGPFLDELVQQHGSAIRDDLLLALVEVDIYRRREAEIQISSRHYHDQFPADAAIINDLFNAQQSLDARSHQISQNATTEKPDPNRPIPQHSRSYHARQIIDDKYELLERLGEGGMGTVWKATRLRDTKDVALKLARRDRLASDEAMQVEREMQFARREAKVLVNLEHDNLVKVLDAQVDREPVYIAMQFVPGGRTLADLIKNGPLPPPQAADIMAQVAEAVAYLHGQDPEIYHRDLKPANILIDSNDKPLVADLGLSVTEDRQLRDSGQYPSLYFLPLDQPISPHLDELLGPVETRTNTAQERDGP